MMLNPNDLLENGRERQRTLIAWRGNQTRLNKLPPLERAAIQFSHRVIATIIRKLKSLGQTRAMGATRNSDDWQQTAS